MLWCPDHRTPGDNTSKTYLAGAFVVGALVLAPPAPDSDPDCWQPTNPRLTATTNNANSFIAFLCRYVLSITPVLLMQIRLNGLESNKRARVAKHYFMGLKPAPLTLKSRRKKAE